MPAGIETNVAIVNVMELFEGDRTVSEAGN